MGDYELVQRGAKHSLCSAKMDAAALAKASKDHQKWIIEALKEGGGTLKYEKLVEIGEEKHCDTLCAMLKILKKKKVLTYNGMVLMYPTNKDEDVTLKNGDY